MSKLGWLTPDTVIPTAYVCRRVVIPDDLGYITAVSGALETLTEAFNWEKFGTATPEEAAALMLNMFWSFLDSEGACMIGSIVPLITAVVPSGMLECDGATYDRVDYPLLYAALDSFFIIDADTFFVPDLRGRTIIGVGTGPGLSTYAEGDTGGEEAHQLITAELASHAHADAGHTHAESLAVPAVAQVVVVPQPVAVPGIGVTGIGFANIQPSGSDVAHENRQPFMALRYAVQAS